MKIPNFDDYEYISNGHHMLFRNKNTGYEVDYIHRFWLILNYIRFKKMEFPNWNQRDLDEVTIQHINKGWI